MNVTKTSLIRLNVPLGRAFFQAIGDTPLVPLFAGTTECLELTNGVETTSANVAMTDEIRLIHDVQVSVIEPEEPNPVAFSALVPFDGEFQYDGHAYKKFSATHALNLHTLLAAEFAGPEMVTTVATQVTVIR